MTAVFQDGGSFEVPMPEPTTFQLNPATRATFTLVNAPSVPNAAPDNGNGVDFSGVNQYGQSVIDGGGPTVSNGA